MYNWRLWLPTPGYFVFWSAIAVGQVFLAPTWLVRSLPSVQLILQILPALLIALFALAFTTLFVAVQQVVNVFSSRAPLILATDSRVRRIVGRTVLVTIGSLALASRIPDSSDLPAYITAIAATLLIMSAHLIFSYGRFAYLLILDYSAPRTFVSQVTEPVMKLLDRDEPRVSEVAFRVPLLGQVVRYALRRDDAEGFAAALEGLDALQGHYIKAGARHPGVRERQYGEGNRERNWLGPALTHIYVTAAEQGLRLEAAQQELDALVDYCGGAALRFIDSNMAAEASPLLDGLARLATTTHQVTSGATNIQSRPATALALAEAHAEEGQLDELASHALALWALTILYMQVQFNLPHPLFKEGVSSLGTNPRWNEARTLVSSAEWQQQWANQIGGKGGSLEFILDVAKYSHDGIATPSLVSYKRDLYQRLLNLLDSLSAATSGEKLSLTLSKLDAANGELGLLASEDVAASTKRYVEVLTDGWAGVAGQGGLVAPTDGETDEKGAVPTREDPRILEVRRAVVDAIEADLGASLGSEPGA